MLKERLTSPVVWLAVVAQVCLILTMVSPNVVEPVKVIAGSVIEILTLFGILNNPTDKKSF